MSSWKTEQCPLSDKAALERAASLLSAATEGPWRSGLDRWAQALTGSPGRKPRHTGLGEWGLARCHRCDACQGVSLLPFIWSVDTFRMSTEHQSNGETKPFNLWRAVSAWSSARLNPAGELPGLCARFNSWQPSPWSSLYYNEKEKHWDRQARAESLVILSTSWPWGGLEDLSSPAPSSVAMGYHLSAWSAAEINI